MAKPLKYKTKRKISHSAFSLKLFGAARKALVTSLPYLLSLVALGFLFGGVIAYAVNSPAFQLQEVRVLNIGTLTQDQAFGFCELHRGENLITLDLVNVQEMIRRKHPEFREVRVQRVLPSRVDVILKRRTPIAQIVFGRYVQIDKDLVILPGSGATPFRNLTLIEGTPFPREGLMVGVMLKDIQTKKAAKLAEILRRSDILRHHSLTRIDIRDPKNVAFYLDVDLEVRIGNSHFMERLELLERTMKTLPLDRDKIRYIDLRFDDVVIGPR